ncbi:receptor-like protein kinase FERONIA [Salvia miltiorrhiza]|uniref:receptor-like protein kinase FERONIA n=1 Tax=Salvia miltiorrhiza TaxID=226208 RepID=UPI0025AB860A|nr:receptor-like protein kinase FERONIA [Salvia miltiorrhiza]
MVSIGAARGLYYLHSRHRIIHRDVKSSNILLDENWVAKISDFGLSKMGPANDSFTHISTNVKGTYGYLDPEYFLTRKLTRKSDVYAFGVVLFEVLSGRPALNMRLDEEQHSLAGWARYCIREGKVDRLIDHNLMEQISPACLKVFVGIAGRCLHTQPQGRPSMADVGMALELALALQQTEDPTGQAEEVENAGRTYSDHSDGVISMDDISLPTGESDRITNEDNLSNGSSDQKSGKKKAKDNGSNNNVTQRWWWDPFGIFSRTPSKSKALQQQPREVIHQFSLKEIQKATNNFHKSHIIGYGGLDNVYRGYIDGGKKSVAIRCSRANASRVSMAHELQTKKATQMTSHDHVASLIGYCETESDMILIYEHMANGTLYDHLHDASKDPLPWKQRLQICIGAARGLKYIHSTDEQTMLHRDLKSNNIWLDDNWTAKVSGWGLSKKTGNNQVPPIIRGLLDSDYIHGEEFTEKSFVYSFGLILFEVLFAEKESDRWFDEDQVRLAQWIKSCMRTNFLLKHGIIIMHRER